MEYKHYYILPTGEKYDNMQDARNSMGLGVQGFRALVRKGTILKVITKSETTEYEQHKA